VVLDGLWDQTSPKEHRLLELSALKKQSLALWVKHTAQVAELPLCLLL
jgi:hypothetical protein